MIRVISKCGLSDKGIRENNEDYILYQDNSRIFVLCDGMGGHGHGEVASKVVSESVFNYLVALNKDEYTVADLQDALDYSLSQLNIENTFDDDKQMGTTLVLVVINKMNVLVGHVGDSRCYLFDKYCQTKFRTKDHSKVQEAVDAEILTEEEAINSPYKNIITRCVIAGNDHVDIEVDELIVEDEDRLLLCTDGVMDALRDTEIQNILMNRSSEDVLEMIKYECASKSKDNFSLIILDLSQDEVNKPKVIINPNETLHTSEEEAEGFFLNNRLDKTVDKTTSKESFNSFLQWIKKRKIFLYSVLFFFLGCAVTVFVTSPLCNKRYETWVRRIETKTKGENKPRHTRCRAYQECVGDTIREQSDTIVLDKSENSATTLGNEE